ncbi:hypothetical protein [Reichenbachiella faecimaris]|uniref:hypothetical protein n=1 Tax=Reichenbachiella faecimaris TaxID=692418 RepID=UPI001C86FA0E|nr:hypothetical protein [Reichenbachiella faecimaris]
MRMHNTPLMNRNALGFIERAKKLNVLPSSLADKQQGLIMLRMNDSEGAKSAFRRYETYLSGILAGISMETKVLNTNHSTINYYRAELDWVKTMIYKSDKL